MKLLSNRGYIILLSVLLFFASCGDASLFDTDKWSNKVEGWEPGVTGVVARGEFSLWDLINQGNDSVVIREGNNLMIQYLDTAIYTIDINKVFHMENENVSFTLHYSIGDGQFIPGITLPGDIELDADVLGSTEANLSEDHILPEGCVLSQLEASATFIYPEMDFAYYIEATFPDIMQNGQVLTLSREVAAHERVTEDLGTILLTMDESQVVELQVNKIIIREGSTLDDPELDFHFGLNNLQFKKVVGKITADPIDIDPGEFDMDVDFLNEIGGNFKFARPELNIIVRNWGVGVPLEVKAQFRGSNAEGDEMDLKLKPGSVLMTEGNKNLYMVPDTLGYNYNNSNIAEFLSLPPTGDISYGGVVSVNPAGADDNVVYSDGKITLDAYVRIPFELSAEKLTYKDTLDDIDIDQKYANKIDTGVIEVIADNGLPLNIELPSLTLMAEDGAMRIVKADKGNAGLKAKAKGSIRYRIGREDAEFLGKTKNILMEAVASTPDNQVETIPADAKLSFRLTITAKAVIDDLDDF